MSLRERNKADKRERIAAAARELFALRGFEGTTVRAIADAAGVGTGTVLLYGASKAELLMALWVDELEAAIQRQERTLGDGRELVDELTHLHAGFFETYAAQPELSRVYVRETLFLPAEQTAPYDAVTTRFVGLLAERIARHRDELHPEVDPGTTALAVFGLYLLHVAVFLRAPGDPAAAIAVLRGVFERLFAPLRRARGR